ncbi:hypothetical protein Q4Q49_16405 [Shewanella sp. SP1S1-7]|uniref:hypothetical protein n=1 Tax=Shewanella sp. SP1S1-7 TaxID=3063536 RepID=UPI00288CC3AD|nr:hypothetical protein [Shewanella sp. SP1S1-7]MDT3336867.1 hypothetical protein [Shewanella sp. SP1S1-7]
MIVGNVFCTQCNIVVEIVNPNGGGRICLNCGNHHLHRRLGPEKCGNCGSENTKEMFFLAGREDEKCPKCNLGLLYFRI